jgi:DNA topoisomerase IB
MARFVDDAGEPRPVDSDQVNDYLRDVMGDDFTAKDFRTWGATMRAAELLGRMPLPERPSERALKACETAVVRIVAQELRNTPAVCRRSYINPVAFQCWRTGRLHGVIAAITNGVGRKGDRVALLLLRRPHPRLAAKPANGAAHLRRAA